MWNVQGPRIWSSFPSKEGEPTVRPCFHQEASLLDFIFQHCTYAVLPHCNEVYDDPRHIWGRTNVLQIKMNALHSPQIKEVMMQSSWNKTAAKARPRSTLPFSKNHESRWRFTPALHSFFLSALHCPYILCQNHQVPGCCGYEQ